MKRKIKDVIDQLRSFKTAFLLSDKKESEYHFNIVGDAGVEDLLNGIYSEKPKTKCLATYIFDQLTDKEKKEVTTIMSDKYNTDLDIENLVMVYYDFKGVIK